MEKTSYTCTLCLPDDAALPREETSLHGLGEDSRFIAFSPSLEYLSPFTGDIACKHVTIIKLIIS